MITPQEATTKGEQTARRAIDLDPQNGEAYSILGLIQAVSKWQWADAEPNLKRGIELTPGSSEAEFQYVVYLDAVNRPQEAVAHMRKALELDPASFLMNRHLGSSLYFARQYDEALVHLNQAAEMEPGKLDFVRGWQSKIYEMQGIRDKAVDLDVAQVHNQSPASSEPLRAIYKRNGWNAYWEARMQFMLERRDNFCVPYEIAVNYIRLGKPDQAFPYFNRAVDQQCWQVEWIMVDPMVDKIRTDPRYPEVLKRMNLPH
jgi:tetratricopeptide (TPR) repeat protein